MKHFGLIIIASLFATACTTVPHSTSQEDAALKAFTTKPAVANLYMFRDNRFWGAGVGWNVALDGHRLGLLPTHTYMFREVQPGKHRLERNQAVFFISVSAGSNYFVRAGSYSLEQVSEKEGRAVVSKLKLHTEPRDSISVSTRLSPARGRRAGSLATPRACVFLAAVHAGYNSALN